MNPAPLTFAAFALWRSARKNPRVKLQWEGDEIAVTIAGESTVARAQRDNIEEAFAVAMALYDTFEAPEQGPLFI